MQFSWRKFTCQLTLVAFLFGAVIPFFAVYSGQIAKADVATLTALYGEEVFICTENGFEWVKVADLADKTHSPKPDRHFECGVCVVSANGAVYAQVPPMVLEVAPYAARELRLHFASAAPATDDLSASPAAPRAPPVIV